MLGGGGGHRLDSEPAGVFPWGPQRRPESLGFSVVTEEGRNLWDSADLSTGRAQGLGSINARHLNAVDT